MTDGAPDHERTRILARYSLVGALSIAAAVLTAGAPDTFLFSGVNKTRALQLMFVVYGALGLVTGLHYFKLPAGRPKQDQPASPLGPSRGLSKNSQLCSALMRSPALSSRNLSWRCGCFRVLVSLGAASAFFFGSNLLSAFSYPVAGYLGTKFGLVNTIVFTHLPAAVCLVVAAFTPNLTIVLFCCLSERRCRRWTCQPAHLMSSLWLLRRSGLLQQVSPQYPEALHRRSVQLFPARS